MLEKNNVNRIALTTDAMYLFVDGSAVNYAFGVGGTEVFPLFSLSEKAFSEEFQAPATSSALAEITAVHKAVEYVSANIKPNQHTAYIIVDTNSVEGFFRKEDNYFMQLSPNFSNFYLIEHIRREIKRLEMLKNVDIRVLNPNNLEKDVFPNFVFWQNITHMYSRHFLNSVNEVFKNFDTPLFKTDNQSKLEINRAASNVRNGFFLRESKFFMNLHKTEEGAWYVDTKQVKSDIRTKLCESKMLYKSILYAMDKVSGELRDSNDTLDHIEFCLYSQYNPEDIMKQLNGSFSFYEKDLEKYQELYDMCKKILNFIENGNLIIRKNLKTRVRTHN